MINIMWDEKFEVGHPRIDHEHQVFLDLIRNVSLESERNSPKERIGRLLQEVKKYAEFHFLSEENIMIDVNYPEYEHHRQDHLELLSRLDEKFYQYNSGATELEQVANFMFEWFAMHTTQTDKRLASFIKNQNSKDAGV